MKVWENIKKMRTDISDYVLHCTREVVRAESNLEAFDALKQILQDGFLKATFAVKQNYRGGIPRATVRGPYPAVCFTEQPLNFFIQSIEANRGRYTEFAVAIRKDELFKYGGRPVIYSDEAVLGKPLSDAEKTEMGYSDAALVYKDGLPDDLQYLWVQYDPTAIWHRQDYPIDWTHEREWRVRSNEVVNKRIGLSGIGQGKIIPIMLPSQQSDTPREPHLVILIDTEAHKEELIIWILTNFKAISKRGKYWQNYAQTLTRSHILSFDEVRSSNQLLGRIEDFIQIRQ